MVNIADWDTFARAAEKLLSENPRKTRFVIKYRHCDSKLVLKVTDDKKCIKYKTDQASDLKKLEKLNMTFLQGFTHKRDATSASVDEAPASPARKSKKAKA
eukprot:TRINITY_DN548_c0_g1_i2.p1 TRINITY_DN548_c0_g1~~TRINITY_DN548_c0_g1_i2.p1  ORF type:complete len:101 (+),score=20.01 TRINITY_DN548_c0_g1_i2:263-565(+)